MTTKIWGNKLDNKYDVFVERKGPYKGSLIIADDKKVLLTEDVSLSYGAKFGPDISDVCEWERRCIEFIDTL
jgi:hypothetical protein